MLNHVAKIIKIIQMMQVKYEINSYKIEKIKKKEIDGHE
jgi:hypothetical protein